MRLLALIFVSRLVTAPAFAAESAERWAQASPDRQKWFRELTVPGGGKNQLCCDPGDGHPVPSRHDLLTDTWYVMWPPESGNWTTVPRSIIVPQTSIDPVAYLFIWNGTWRCFVRPDTGI